VLALYRAKAAAGPRNRQKETGFEWHWCLWTEILIDEQSLYLFSSEKGVIVQAFTIEPLKRDAGAKPALVLPSGESRFSPSNLGARPIFSLPALHHGTLRINTSSLTAWSSTLTESVDSGASVRVLEGLSAFFSFDPASNWGR